MKNYTSKKEKTRKIVNYEMEKSFCGKLITIIIIISAEDEGAKKKLSQPLMRGDNESC
jgi:hypothetical protein